MPVQNPYEQYQRNKILTASPAELTLMLYEGAIKFCNIAIMAIEQKEIEKAHINIMNTHLRSLRDTWKEVMKRCNKA